MIPVFIRQVWGRVIYRDIRSVLMSGGYRVRKFRVIHRSWQLVHHHRVGGVTTNAEWVGLGASFGNQSMEAILS